MAVLLTSATGAPRPQYAIVILGLCLLIALAFVAGRDNSDLALTVALGALGGVALYHATFGFAGAWRRFQKESRGAGIRAQLLLIALAASISFPLIVYGSALGWEDDTWVFSIGLASAIGAIMFGIGMQLGGGCGSGVLFAAGGGSLRLVFTLFGFLAGSFLWTISHEVWRDLPTLPALSLIKSMGLPLAWLTTLAGLGGLAVVTVYLEKISHGSLEATRRTNSWLFGNWSLRLGAVLLAVVVIGCLIVNGHPWGITSAYPLWAAKLADLAGLPVREFRYWQGSEFERSILVDTTSVMNFGVILGALLAAGLAGQFAPKVRISFRLIVVSIIGGVLMGYGARLAHGCNIGGLIGGIVSASVHGWWWLLFGAIGSAAGVRLSERLLSRGNWRSF